LGRGRDTWKRRRRHEATVKGPLNKGRKSNVRVVKTITREEGRSITYRGRKVHLTAEGVLRKAAGKYRQPTREDSLKPTGSGHSIRTAIRRGGGSRARRRRRETFTQACFGHAGRGKRRVVRKRGGRAETKALGKGSKEEVRGHGLYHSCLKGELCMGKGKSDMEWLA